MYKVYLADDNELFRESMLQTIDWAKQDCVLVGSAGDGETACRDILRLKPDIVLMDIRMPGMSGLEVASILQQRRERARIILITGYSDFGYAQKGIRVGVFDYLLKPVDDSELQNVIARAIRSLAEIPEQDKPYDVKNSVCRYDQKKNQLFKGALEEDPDMLEELSHAVVEDFCFVHYELLRICPGTGTTEEALPMREWVQSVQSAIAQSGQEGTESCSALFGSALYVLVLYTRFMEPKEDDVCAISFASAILSHTEQDACISISGCHDSFSELSKAVEETEFSYDSRFFIENRKIIHYHSLKSRSIAELYPIMRKEEEAQNALRQNPKEGEAVLEELEEMLKKCDVLDKNVVQSVLTNLAVMMDAMLLEYEKNEPEGRKDEFHSAVQEMLQARTMTETFQILKRYAVKLAVHAESASGTSRSAVAQKIQNYLEEHYAEQISLKDVADYVGLSQGHVCRVLKSETNDTFVNLLNKIRIGKAREMLMAHKYKVYEVAEAVGFTNYAYFYQAYRKYTGEAPTKS